MCWVRYCFFLYKHSSLALAFFSNDWAISLKDKVWYYVAPKYFKDVVDLIVKLLHVISKLVLHLIFWGEPKGIDSVLPRWSESLLSINHWLKQFKPSVKSCSIYCLFCLALRFLSHQRIKAACFRQQLKCHWSKLKIKEVLKLSLGEATGNGEHDEMCSIWKMIWTKQEYHC